ncbi:hypothetical protein BD293_4405 [Roseinatronobacter monicus]|uniref:Uncharacterized protein n=1 Tax=Roseinatronobacter monicus TaxID=393481 RepID=A0A543K3R7_9RHOB|nr:hypothetical protein BD293_4405 [Roseinatronobacter monicus]
MSTLRFGWGNSQGVFEWSAALSLWELHENVQLLDGHTSGTPAPQSTLA